MEYGNVSRSRNLWSAEEDETLRQRVESYGSSVFFETSRYEQELTVFQRKIKSTGAELLLAFPDATTRTVANGGIIEYRQT
jgi:hypothetical protein